MPPLDPEELDELLDELDEEEELLPPVEVLVEPPLVELPPEEVLVGPPLLVEEITTLPPPPYPPLPPITTGIELPPPCIGGAGGI